MRLCLATNNKHKVEELKQMLGQEYEILTMADIGCSDEIEETGSTFQENSKIKAEYIFKKYNINVLADDSGLEVDALENRPGVYSARYAGQPTNHDANMNKVLNEMGDNPNREARFKTVITLILEGQVKFFEGLVSGQITKTKIGSDGFGYDPIFIPDGYEMTFAEMTSEQKNQISHRARAIEKMIAFLKA